MATSRTSPAEEPSQAPGPDAPSPARAQPAVPAAASAAARFRGPVKWLAFGELIRSGRAVKVATEFATYGDGRKAMAGNPCAFYDLTAAKDISTSQPFVLDYLADTGDGFNATYAMARALTGQCPVNGSAEPTDHPLRQRADLLVLGGDEVYPVASAQNYDDRLLNVYDLADPIGADDDHLPHPNNATYPARARYVAAIPGNHDWYDSLGAFIPNFCASWREYPDDTATGVAVAPRPTRDILMGRYPFQSRSYFAARLPHNWWVWGIDIQLDAEIDDSQGDYFRHARTLIAGGDRVILCTARPSWVDPAEPGRDYLCNRGRLAWFANRMFSNDEGPDPATWDCPPDELSRVPLMLSGDKHHYLHHVRDRAKEPRVATGDSEPTAPEHLVTCGGGGAYASSTHHAGDVTVPWHLSEDTATPYRLLAEKSFPSPADSRGKLSRGFWKIPLINGWATPLLVAALVAILAVLLLRVSWAPTPGRWVAAGAGVAAVTGVTIALALAFRPRNLSKPRQWGIAFLLGAVHAFGYVVAAALGLIAGLAAGYLTASLTGTVIAPPPEGAVDPTFYDLAGLWPPDGWADASGALWTVHPVLVSVVAIIVAAGVLTVAALGVFATYWRISDSVGWHHNEFFAGMCIEGYKSFIRIVIAPPPADHPDQAGNLAITVYGVRDVEPNLKAARAGADHTSLIDPTIEVIDSWTIPAQT